MITVRLQGGLGNQLFQLAAAFQIQKYTRCEILLYEKSLTQYATQRKPWLKELVPSLKTIDRLPYFKESILNKRLNKIAPFLFPWYVNTKSISSATKQRSYILDDYFQDVVPIKFGISEVIKNISHLQANSIKVKNVINELLVEVKDISQLAAVHIRRADYLKKPFNKIYPVLSDAYYKKAMAVINTNETIKKWVIFSEEKETLSPCFQQANHVNISAYCLNDFEEFLLMASFRHIIVANSTYSFWAAIVARKEKSVIIAPAYWIHIPKENVQWQNNLKQYGFITID